VNISQAYKILDIDNKSTLYEIRKAYKKRAFETHPDRTKGSATDFILVQAAYTFLENYLSKDKNQEENELNKIFNNQFDSQLQERINQVMRAFDLFTSQSVSKMDQIYEELKELIINTVNNCGGSYDLRVKAAKSINDCWQNFLTQILNYLEDNIELIVVNEEIWLKEYLKPAINQAKILNPPKWFESYHYSSVIVFISIIFIVYGFIQTNYFIIILSILLIFMSIRAQLSYSKRYNPYLTLDGLNLGELKEQLKSVKINFDSIGLTRDESAVGLGVVGAGLGFLVGGPVGASVGCAAGAIWGSLTGKPLDKLKEEVYNMAISSINIGINRLRREILERIEIVKKTLIKDMRNNFYRNVNKVLLLTAPVKQIERRRIKND